MRSDHTWNLIDDTDTDRNERGMISDDKPWRREEEEIIKHGIIPKVHGCLSFAAWLPGGPATRPKREVASTPSSIFLFSEQSDPDRNHAILASLVSVAVRIC